MSNGKPLSAQDRLKPLTDLWMHQNTLMWSRLQTLLLIQGGFLGVGYALWKGHWPFWGQCAVGIVIFWTGCLWIIAMRDRNHRDRYGADLARLGFGLHAGRHSTHLSLASFFIAIAFLSAEIIDVGALYLFGTNPG